MAKECAAGEMRSRINVIRATKTIDSDGFQSETTRRVLTGVWCKWVWAHGSEVLENDRLNLGQVATITMHYTNAIGVEDRVILVSEGKNARPFEIISIDAVQEKRRWLEIKARRVVKA